VTAPSNCLYPDVIRTLLGMVFLLVGLAAVSMGMIDVEKKWSILLKPERMLGGIAEEKSNFS
jgi:hypothetical protein